MENGQSFATETVERSRFLESASKIMTAVVAMIADGTAMDQVLGSEPDCVYLKSADGTVLYNNVACQQMFSKASQMVGRRARTMVSESLAQISNMTDSMIMTGCPHIMCCHLGHSEAGELLRMSTAKYTLLGLGHPSLAILGVTRIHEKLSENGDTRVQLNSLVMNWHQFQKLNPMHRQTAIQLVCSNSLQSIAESRGVSKRTIENHRRIIFEALDVATTVELAKLLVQFQANGFGDLGVL